MKSLKGTQTEKNILTAFSGESQARNRYTYFASQAKKEGFVQISHIFEETADQEKEHAKRFFSFLEGGMGEKLDGLDVGDRVDDLARDHGAGRGSGELGIGMAPGATGSAAMAICAGGI